MTRHATRCQYPQKSTEGPRRQRQSDNAPHLAPVVHPAVALLERALLRVAGQVSARDVVMVPCLGTAQAGEEAFRAVGAGDAVAVGELVVDALDDVVAVQRVPARRVVSVNLGAGGNVVCGCRRAPSLRS